MSKKELVLSNDTKRKEFIRNYQSWPLVRMDKFNGFNYYRYTFKDGSFFTALEHKTNFHKETTAIITLTEAEKIYVPVASTQADLVNHLKNVCK